jgi:phosphoglycolate phosphatase-like HAD superfamily hydrolase
VDARALLIVDLDGPILDVAPRYFAAHLEALAASGATPLVADAAAFWQAKRRSEPVARDASAASPTSASITYAAAFKERVERDDLLTLDRLQPGALVALARLSGRHPLAVLSLRTNVAGARATVWRLGIDELAEVTFVPHNPDGKVAQARALVAARATPGVLAVIGDTEADAAVAEALGAPFWAVSCGIREPARLHGFGAARLEESLEAYV